MTDKLFMTWVEMQEVGQFLEELTNLTISHGFVVGNGQLFNVSCPGNADYVYVIQYTDEYGYIFTDEDAVE